MAEVEGPDPVGEPGRHVHDAFARLRQHCACR
jgi:hypothetical protein